jgi:recombination protein RecA
MSVTEQEKAAKARDAALQGALTQIERQFGKGTVMRMGDEGAQVRVNAIPTGALSLDLALGIGGVPRGRIVEVFGPESSGKTTLIYHILAEAQKLGGVCAFIDAEHAMDPLYAQKIGLDIDELLVSQPDYGEQALEIADMLVRSSAVDVIAVDSVAAGRPRVEVLLLPAPRHTADRDAEGRHRGGRQPRPRQGRQEQGRGPVPAG